MALARHFGRIDPFQPDNETIAAYLERVELYFQANDIRNEKKVSILLTSIGDKTYTLLRNHFAPAKPAEQTLANIEAALKKLFEPAKIVIAERFYFHRRNQAEDESVSDYVAELRRLSITCDFGQFLDQALRDRLVGGLKSESAQKKLLTEEDKDLTFVKAVEIAEAIEAAEASTQQFNRRFTATVNRVTQPCHRCGRSNHAPADCRFKDAICHSCKKKGHLASVCRSKKATPDTLDTSKKASKAPKRRYQNFRRNKWIQAEEKQSSGDSEPELPMHTVGHASTHPITVDLKINDKHVQMELDTGASVTIISEQIKDKLFPNTPLQRSSLKLKTYTGESLPVLGEMPVHVAYGDQQCSLTLTVVEGQGSCLLGRDWLSKLRLDWKTIGSVRLQQGKVQLSNLLKKYDSVFKDGLGTMHHFKANLRVKAGTQPVFHRPRPTPFAIRDDIGKELDRLEREGIIEKVETSKWAAPIVPVPKKRWSNKSLW